MNLRLEPYLTQLPRWPTTGKHILAQFDDQYIVVYQAYKPSIAEYAAAHGKFGQDFSFNRMTWIKPNFLWMMYRSGWAGKAGQERILALTLSRTDFDELLSLAVVSSFHAAAQGTQEEWQEAVTRSDVRLQWDPDHAPNGQPVQRRAIQLGLRGEILRQFNDEWLQGVQDITEFVQEQRQNIQNLDQLVMPSEAVYPVSNEQTAFRLGLTGQ